MVIFFFVSDNIFHSENYIYISVFCDLMSNQIYSYTIMVCLLVPQNGGGSWGAGGWCITVIKQYMLVQIWIINICRLRCLKTWHMESLHQLERESERERERERKWLTWMVHNSHYWSRWANNLFYCEGALNRLFYCIFSIIWHHLYKYYKKCLQIFCWLWVSAEYGHWIISLIFAWDS